MSIKRSRFLLIKLVIQKFKLVFPIPIRIAEEILYQIQDLWEFISIFSKAGKVKKIGVTIHTIIYFFEGLREYGQFDIVDVDVKDGKDKVKIKIALR